MSQKEASSASLLFQAAGAKAQIQPVTLTEGQAEAEKTEQSAESVGSKVGEDPGLHSKPSALHFGAGVSESPTDLPVNLSVIMRGP